MEKLPSQPILNEVLWETGKYGTQEKLLKVNTKQRFPEYLL